MDGALSRVPANFYEHVWSILERTPDGIRLCNILLPQVNQKGMLNHMFSSSPSNPPYPT